MMKALFNFTAVVISLFAFIPAYAVPPGMTVEYTKSPQGKVVFSGDTHAAQKLECKDCHPKPFEQKKGVAPMGLEEHMGGKTSCFFCHNGKITFGVEGNCAECHHQ